MPHAVDYETDITATTGFVSGAAAIRRRMIHRLERVVGEWAFDRSRGLLPQEQIRPFSAVGFRRRLQREITTMPGVRSVSIRSVTETDGAVSASGSVLLESGDTLALQATLPGPAQQNLPPTILVLMP